MTTFPSRSAGRRRHQTGMALVICLALLVLITAAVMAFFARATANRLVETSRANRVKAELLTQSAGDYVVGRFLQEVSDSANSIASTVSGRTTYHPRASTNAVPTRLLSASISTTDTNFFNLVRQSVPGADSNATTISTSQAAKSGRAISASRWNAPILLGGAGFSAASQLPNWIYLMPDGTATNVASTNVVGRFAYNVYDEGGLLDINVAGYPSSVSGENLAVIKGTLAGADLTQLGMAQASIDELVAFRNPDSGNAAAYANLVKEASRDGFNFRRGGTYQNNLFTSRQDLIRYAQSQNVGLAEFLPFLTTLTKGLTSPSYRPDPARPKVGANDDRYNPSILGLRVATSFMRNDGSTAKPGDLLLERRFPLSRLNWIGKTGVQGGASKEDVERAFGLEYDEGAGVWRYVHGDSGTILTLENVRDLSTPREPNFFELLQAGLRYGSLGKSGGGNAAAQAVDRAIANQVFQIGANLIDQADENGTPTTIRFGSADFYGVENLPYLNRVFMTPYRLHGATQPATHENAGIWFQPEIWNPHATTSSVPADTPTTFRIVATGRVAAAFGHMSSEDVAYPEGYTMGPIKSFPDPASDAGAGIRFSTASANFSQPQSLRPENGASAAGQDVVTDDGLQNFIGIHAGTVTVPDQRQTGEAEDSLYKYATVFFQTPASFLLQYQEGGRWHTYSQVSQIDVQGYDGERPVGGLFRNYIPASFYSLIDPRTDRFNVTVGFTEMAPTDLRFGPNFDSGLTQRSTADIGAQRHGGVAAWPGWIFGGPDVIGATQGYFGTLSDNLPGSVTRYTDADGVLRPADGAYTTGNLPHGYPLATNNADSRPVVLNRPFRSVAEMGYASRDIPWKHLDFFSKDSGDAALLDLFCVTESSAVSGDTSSLLVESGRVNLNTRQAKVLQAILANSLKSETGDLLSSADAASLANLLVARTTDPARGPLVNVNELVTQWAQDLHYADQRDTVVKRRRETAVRALADVGNTRTWNLLIDIVAQNGRITPNDSSPFLVEGEQRCWLHVVIDRATGKVVYQFNELVYE